MLDPILILSHAQAKELAGKRWVLDGQIYRFKNYDKNQPGQPPWRSGNEGKAFPLLDDGGKTVAYAKFFSSPSPKRLDRTLWIMAQELHEWCPHLVGSPRLWTDSRNVGRPEGVQFDITGCLAYAAPGETWLELKYRLAEAKTTLDLSQRLQCVRDLVYALATLERAGIVHGDLSPQNIIVNTPVPAERPALYLIDFDAFAVPKAGSKLILPIGEGGTYGTIGYCPPDLAERAEKGDTTLAPYSDRHGRDMLILELLFSGIGVPVEDPPEQWDARSLQLWIGALAARCPSDLERILAHLLPPQVFALEERDRASSVALAQALGMSVVNRELVWVSQRPSMSAPPTPTPAAQSITPAAGGASRQGKLTVQLPTATHTMLPRRASHPRRWWLAALATIVAPGLGQLYNGDLTKAVVCLYAPLLAVVEGTVELSRGYIVYIVLVLLILADAVYRSIRQRQFTKKKFNRWWVYILAIISSWALSIFAVVAVDSYNLHGALVSRNRLLVARPSVNDLMGRLRSPDVAVRTSAADQLSEIGMPAVKPLVAALTDSDPNVRESAISALERIVAAQKTASGDNEFEATTTESLIAATKETDSYVRALATTALAELTFLHFQDGIKDLRPIEALIGARADPDVFVRTSADAGLQHLKGPLTAALNDRRPEVQRLAKAALYPWGDSQSNPGADLDTLPGETLEINGKWIADGRTAIAITGDISISSNNLTMVGVDYQLTLVRTVDASDLRNLGKRFLVANPKEAQLFKAKIPAHRRLINGNDICGLDKDANWILAITDFSPPATHGLQLAFFAGDNEPSLYDDSADLCGTFGYYRIQRVDISAGDTSEYWLDPVTRLFWARKDNGSGIDWYGAQSYCSSLSVDGQKGWRLPELNELQSIYDAASPGHIKGGISLSASNTWSGNSAIARGGPSNALAAWVFTFDTGGSFRSGIGSDLGNRALCVRGAEKVGHSTTIDRTGIQ